MAKAMYKLDKETETVFTHLQKHQDIKAGLQFLEADQAQTLQEQIELAEISAPPFEETKRALAYKNKLEQLGLEEVKQDSEGNVYGVLKGNRPGPKLFVSAHIDSVFSSDTDVTVTEKDGLYYGPGITDDARGLAALLSIVRAFNHTGIKPEADIIFGGTVGEEGPGDLRGVKAFFSENKDVEGFISIDSVSPSAIIYKGTGSYRYEITYSGPGGHSFGAFGTPSAVHAAGRAIAMIADLETSTDPKTSFNVGVVEGGTIPTAIAEQSKLYLDIRSNGKKELDEIDSRVRVIFQQAAEQENKRWGYVGQKGIQVELNKLGNRPVGTQLDEAAIVQTAWAATEQLGLVPTLEQAVSTDANYPISIGIPAITLGAGGDAGGAHSLDEWFDPTDAHLGPQRVFLTILGLSGVARTTLPLLSSK
ncbi:M20/M25/M40 family metallo-hydrolase [Alkalicoccobacillus murimartini]|uniref:Acetylornithine deacetylase/succinyl-diaminopimelate desuccinylase-like protein n=1 Tax=Alkalicoccobacillus murimartini TaxID=171685 RepID=A0ABT9YKU8_9BACI|nr:M20/M25/M40 family metallo-hydrolase [Alkalicoccobacillus murimartini]MDQ0208495.1 acetylornithine deacetylase/succinyl-diaminopimelate desuccinylase-like protein [Alkalicoccobacillus murimartini]